MKYCAIGYLVGQLLGVFFYTTLPDDCRVGHVGVLLLIMAVASLSSMGGFFGLWLDACLREEKP